MVELNPETSSPTAPSPKVVDFLVVPAKGAAKALFDRLKQLQITGAIAKQYIAILTKASLASADFHQLASSHIMSTCSAENGRELHLSPVLGLQLLINELARSEMEIANNIRKLNYSARLPFHDAIRQLDAQNKTINQLLAMDRLGKHHQRNEADICLKAAEINSLIRLLRAACLPYWTVPDPHLDPYFLCKSIRLRLNEFQKLENEYIKLCVHEGEAGRALETRVARTLQGIPPELERLMRQMIDQCNEKLTSVENKAREVELQSDWTDFEGPKEESQSIRMTADHHPNEERFLQFRRLHLTTLEVQRKVAQHIDGTLKGIWRFRSKLSANKFLATKKVYHTLGTWWVSTAGHLIGYNSAESCLVSMFNLHKCKLAGMTQGLEWEYFTLEGQEMTFSEGKTKRGRKKQHKFRLSKVEASALNDVLKEFCPV